MDRIGPRKTGIGIEIFWGVGSDRNDPILPLGSVTMERSSVPVTRPEISSADSNAYYVNETCTWKMPDKEKCGVKIVEQDGTRGNFHRHFYREHAQRPIDNPQSI